jgi:hypothetical protein
LAGGTSDSPAREGKRFAEGSEMITLFLCYKPTIFFVASKKINSDCVDRYSQAELGIFEDNHYIVTFKKEP